MSREFGESINLDGGVSFNVISIGYWPIFCIVRIEVTNEDLQVAEIYIKLYFEYMP